MRATGSVIRILCAVGLVFAWSTAASPDDEAVPAVRATAQIKGCTDPNITGRAFLTERPSTEGVKLVDVTVVVQGLPPGKHAVHIHAATGMAPTACTPTCAAAGGHFDPGPAGDPTPDGVGGNHPFHSGDLINLVVDDTGVGSLHTTTSRVTLSPGPLSVFNGNGSAIIVHEKPDTYCPNGNNAENMGCAGGPRQACGVIQPAPSAPEEDGQDDGESQ